MGRLTYSIVCFLAVLLAPTPGQVPAPARAPRVIPVLVASYFPLAGENIDIEVTGDWGRPYAETRAKCERLTREVAAALEKGSTFRGYKEPDARPSLTYRIVASLTFKKPLPTRPLRPGERVPMTDYAAILEQIAAADWIENRGVKQVWIWGYHGGVVGLWESNMAGPFGDVSNSNRDLADLPILKSTYTVYHYNYQRGLGEALENHMHQLEALLNHVDGRDRTAPEKWSELLFWGKFVGSDASHKIVTSPARCGWTHYAPNSESDYDWQNKRFVETDIEDWKPDGHGRTLKINAARWNFDPVQWRIYWMQAIPGAGNGLSYKGAPLRDWWSFVYDWDRAQREKWTLVEQPARPATRPAHTDLYLLAPSAFPSAGPELTKAEKASLAKVAAEWVALGRWAASRGLVTEAGECQRLAREADPDSPGLEALSEGVEPAEASEADREAWLRRRDNSAEKAAACYEKLFQAGPRGADPQLQQRFDGYLLRALETAPSERRWTTVAAAAARLAGTKEAERAGRIAGRALSLGPPQKQAQRFLAVLDGAATSGPLLMTASTHPLRYWLSLPKGFKRAKGVTHPVLVALDGAGSNFLAMARSYADARGSLPFIVAAPCTFSNTNKIEGKLRQKYAQIYSEPALSQGAEGRLAWDEEGLLAMLSDLRAHFDAQERIFATGFSGGGGVLYQLIFKHPNLLAAAAPACANFSDQGYGSLKGKASPQDLTLPVFILTGGKDPHREHTHGNPAIPGIEPQTDAAMRMFEHLGYTRVERSLLPALGHSPAVREVLQRLEPFWPGK